MPKQLEPIKMKGDKPKAPVKITKSATREYSIEELVQLIGGVQSAQKHDITTQSPVQNMHGQGGLLSRPGVRPEMWSALPRARTLSNILPFFESPYSDQIHEILTGQLADTGENANSFCELGPEAGKLKVCQQITKFGEINVSSEKVELPRVGLRRDRADTPRQLLNSGAVDERFIPQGFALFPQDSQNLLASMQYRMGIQVERSIGLTEFAGVQGASTISGMQSEFRGVEGWVRDNYVDAVEGVPCPAANSYIIDFDENISGTASDGRLFTTAVTDVMMTLRDLARQTRIDTEWILVMHPYLFYVIVDIIACQQNISRCSFPAGTGNALNVDAHRVNEERIAMLTGEYLMINGVRFPVLLADGIDDGAQGNNEYKQSFFMLPLRGNGMPLMYYEYHNMANQYAQDFVNQMAGLNYTTINNGLYGFASHQTGGCISYSLYAMVRLMLDTPFLAGRIDNIKFSYNLGTNTPYPGRSLYRDGGVSIVS